MYELDVHVHVYQEHCMSKSRACVCTVNDMKEQGKHNTKTSYCHQEQN